MTRASTCRPARADRRCAAFAADRRRALVGAAAPLGAQAHRRVQQQRAGQLCRRPDRAAGPAEPRRAVGQCRHHPGRPAAARRRAPRSPTPTPARCKIQRIDATGGVTVTRGNETARGDVAVYDFNRRIITMAGNVALRRGGDTLNGGRLTIDLDQRRLERRRAFGGAGRARRRRPAGSAARSPFRSNSLRRPDPAATGAGAAQLGTCLDGRQPDGHQRRQFPDVGDHHSAVRSGRVRPLHHRLPDPDDHPQFSQCDGAGADVDDPRIPRRRRCWRCAESLNLDLAERSVHAADTDLLTEWPRPNPPGEYCFYIVTKHVTTI